MSTSTDVAEGKLRSAAAQDPIPDDERPMVERQWLGLMDNLGRIGIPRAVFVNWSTWPVVAIRLTVTALVEQTPGPGAGEAMQ